MIRALDLASILTTYIFRWADFPDLSPEDQKELEDLYEKFKDSQGDEETEAESLSEETASTFIITNPAIVFLFPYKQYTAIYVSKPPGGGYLKGYTGQVPTGRSEGNVSYQAAGDPKMVDNVAVRAYGPNLACTFRDVLIPKVIYKGSWTERAFSAFGYFRFFPK